MTSTPTDDFVQFMSRRLAASTAFVNGDIEPLAQLSTRGSPATIFGPRGNTVQGADKVNAANAQGAAIFGPGASNSLEIMHQSADESLAYWVGIQRSTVNISGQHQPLSMELRVTEIFRREHAGWMLIHRHADPLSSQHD
ncbi:nuclear transport factor 2 family protein [Lapillicoccus sp.]|uniref:YybH family protein n=1 Tax=Lapillicoccus sp. TaxID=1909287 RepID=UPI003265A31F